MIKSPELQSLESFVSIGERIATVVFVAGMVVLAFLFMATKPAAAARIVATPVIVVDANGSAAFVRPGRAAKSKCPATLQTDDLGATFYAVFKKRGC